jgi:glycosyltransferase involved in cell wall biosynthesis
VIAAKIDAVDRAYYEHAIAPLIRNNHNVEYIGEVDERDKDELLGGAYAYLFPIDWPEPFGLTMVEAMATGTPVIAYRAGSVPKVVVDGVTGFICNTVHAMVDAISCVPQLDCSACRRRVEQHFSIEAMVDGYERVYARSVERGRILAKTNTLVATS